MTNDDYRRALRFFPAEPGQQVPRAHLQRHRGELRCGDCWAALLWGDELCLGGDPFGSPVDPGRLQDQVEVDIRLSCEVPARSRITAPAGEPAALGALPAADWRGFCYTPAVWTPLLRARFAEVHAWTRVGFVGAPPYPAPDHPVRSPEPGDEEALIEFGQPWLWKYHDSAAGLIATGRSRVALADGRPRAAAAVFAADDAYAELAVVTHPGFRRRGLGRAAAVALAAAVAAEGLTPYWETGADNVGSVAIPLSLGWEQVKLTPMYTINRRPPLD